MPSNCRTNNFSENYNGYIKIQLGKNRYINQVNFIHFIKTQSQRYLNKLHGNANTNKLILKNKEDKNILKDTEEKTIINKENNVYNNNNEKDKDKNIICDTIDNNDLLNDNTNNLLNENIEKIIIHILII